MAWQTWGKRVAVGTLAGIGALLAYGVAIEPRFIYQREYVVRLPHLPEAWQGRRIALISDFQVGMFLANTDTMRRMVRRIIALRPDALLFAGDFIYHPSGRALGEAARAEKLVRPLIEAGIPVIAVLGNHDYGISTPGDKPDPAAAEHLCQVMEKLGVSMLRNSWVALPPPGSGQAPIQREQTRQATITARTAGNGHQGETTHAASTTYPSAVDAVPDQSLYIVGIDSTWAHRDHPKEALRGLPDNAARIVLMHNPYSFPEFPAHSAPFAVAGHTHGGQIRVPGLPHWSYLTLLHHNESHADGWTRPFGQAGNHLYITIGVGFSGFPARINCVPELALFTLQPESAGLDRWAPKGKSFHL